MSSVTPQSRSLQSCITRAPIIPLLYLSSSPSLALSLLTIGSSPLERSLFRKHPPPPSLASSSPRSLHPRLLILTTNTRSTYGISLLLPHHAGNHSNRPQSPDSSIVSNRVVTTENHSFSLPSPWTLPG